MKKRKLNCLEMMAAENREGLSEISADKGPTVDAGQGLRGIMQKKEEKV